MRPARWILLPVLLAACGDDGGASPDAGPRAWESVETTTDDGEILIEKVSYRADGLRVFGQVCRPRAAGVYPVLVVNHGGFAGLGAEWNGGSCADGARNDFVVIESAYRGEDGSEGTIEVCLGEVTDVLVMIDIALAQPYANPRRVLMWGASHGGCITTRAVQRGAPVHGAVDVFGPSDLAAEHAFWQAGIASNSPWRSFYEQLLAITEAATGGSPAAFPEAYRVRSPRAFAAELTASPVPFMILQGTVDPLVPTPESCRLAAAAGGFESYHLDGAQAVTTAAPADCVGDALVWHPPPRLTTTWPGARYLVVYDGVDHGFNGPGGMAMFGDLLGFLIAKLPPA